MIPPKPSSVPLTPAQKSAITKAKNKSNKATRAAEVADFWKLYDAEDKARYDDIRKAENQAALEHHRLMNLPRKPATPIPTKPTKPPPTPKPIERPPPNYKLQRTKNDTTGKRNNALKAAGQANRANPGESLHHQYLLEHERVRVIHGNPSTPVVPTPTIPTNLGSTAPSPSKNPPLDQSIIRRNWEFAAPWMQINDPMTHKEADFYVEQHRRADRGEVPRPEWNARGYPLRRMREKEADKMHAKLARPFTPTSKLTGIPKPPPKPAWGYALGRPMGQLALFPRGNNEGVVRSGTGVDVSPQLKPTKVSANQLQLELPNPSPRKDPSLQYTPPKPPPNTGKGRLVPTPESDIKISGPTTYTRIPRGTRGAIRGAKGFGGGALGVLAAPLIYGAAFGIKERSFSGFLKGLDIWAGGGTPPRGPDA